MNPPTTLIVGLGNPGDQYAGTRHNAGWLALDRYAAKQEAGGWQASGKYEAALARAGSRLLAKPETFMNESGRSVKALVRMYKIKRSNLLVVIDDIDLPFGTVRIRPEGGSGGHHGLASVIDALGTKSFARLRIGVGRPPSGTTAHVLGPFSTDEHQGLPEVLDQVTDRIDEWLEGTDG